MTTQYFVCSHDGKHTYEHPSKEEANASCSALNGGWNDGSRRTWYVTERITAVDVNLPNTDPMLRFMVFAVIVYAIVLGVALFF